MHDGECERSNGPPIARSLQQGPVGGIKNGSRGRDLAPAVGSLGDLRSWGPAGRRLCASPGNRDRRLTTEYLSTEVIFGFGLSSQQPILDHVKQQLLNGLLQRDGLLGAQKHSRDGDFPS